MIAFDKWSVTPPADTSSQAAPIEPDANQQHLQALMDMGFARERCLEAI